MARSAKPLRIAVIGAGIAGLAAAWLLARKHAVVLYEKADYLGGHTNTVDVSLDGVTHGVDTGFLVFNRRTYPHLSALFEILQLDIAASEMSFSVSLAEENVEWSGSDLSAVFAQKRNLARPAFWRMLQEILRFNRDTSWLVRAGAALDVPEVSLGEYLDELGYGPTFRDWYLLPMAAAIWSCPTQQMLEYPLATFLRFSYNHGLLQVFNRPQWLTVRGGAKKYVERLAREIPQVRIGTPVQRLTRERDCVRIETRSTGEAFDAAVLACHSDQQLALLGDFASVEERAVLGSVRYQPNRAVLHTDTALLPRRRATWSAWNYMSGKGETELRPVSVSYLINRLQPLPFTRPVIVSLNPFIEPRRHAVIAEFEYAHPIFDAGAIRAQQRIEALQGQQRTWYCGAWTGYGFHEDGLNSALAVASAFGVRAPWEEQTTPSLMEAA
jgi:predicted NAD/FAD-binding protein